MDKITLKALRESIEHWRKLYLGSPGAGSPQGIDCALCRAFVFKTNTCRGCPVYNKTRLFNCRGTPHAEASAAHSKYGNRSPQFKEKALAMLEFLQSLLPAEAKENKVAAPSKVATNCASISASLDSIAKLLYATANLPGTSLDDEGSLSSYGDELELIKSRVDSIADNYKSAPAPRKIKRAVPWRS